MKDNTDIITFAEVMRKEACRNTGKPPTFRIFSGWKFGISYGPVPLPAKQIVDTIKGPLAKRVGHPELGTASYEQIEAVTRANTRVNDQQWIFSACLHPRGRSSNEEDWKFLGRVLAAIGVPENSCLTPIQKTHPNHVHYWMWDSQ